MLCPEENEREVEAPKNQIFSFVVYVSILSLPRPFPAPRRVSVKNKTKLIVIQRDNLQAGGKGVLGRENLNGRKLLLQLSDANWSQTSSVVASRHRPQRKNVYIIIVIFPNLVAIFHSEKR